ncbi:MAG: DoxX family membrane protein [Bacteroidetes bacterium]|nr:DoxX family membrane protein [Bacteroidota bacterium]
MTINLLKWALRIIAAFILLQTLFFKFTGAEESVYIFKTMGMEPWGRIGSGIVELIASILLLIPRTTWIGAALALGTILGAIASHLFVLGIEVLGDGGQLFFMAIIVALCTASLLWMERTSVFNFLKTRKI